MYDFKRIEPKVDGCVELVFEAPGQVMCGIEGVPATLRVSARAIFNSDSELNNGDYSFTPGALDHALVAVFNYARENAALEDRQELMCSLPSVLDGRTAYTFPSPVRAYCA